MRSLVGLLLVGSVGAGAAAGAASGSLRAAERRAEPARVAFVMPPSRSSVVTSRDGEPARADGARPPAGVEEPAFEAAQADIESEPPYAEPRLVSTGKVTTVYARPNTDARRLGYLRAGAVVARSAKTVAGKGCEAGFHEIAPEGYVCIGATASTDVEHVMARVVPRRADRDGAMPYLYGIVAHAGMPLYTRVPTAPEQRRAEPDLGGHLRRKPGHGFEHVGDDPLPWFLQDGSPSISTHGYRRSRGQLVERRTLPRSGYAFVSTFEAEGRRYGLTTDLVLVPLDRATRVEPSRFHGLPLSEETPLPVAFSRSRKVGLYSGDPATRGLKFERFLEYREAVPVTGRTARVGKLVYLETRAGDWIRDEHLVLVGARQELPPGVKENDKWIDVSVLKQSLVAYVGRQPVFVTLVSTGKDGIEDPETSHATVRGDFRVHTKHVSVTMDGDDPGDEFELNDVPYVQYFSRGYALHAAYWHDGFGTPRSHGCVNLAPLDARWLFGWTDPPVPTTWHGAMSVARGTVISIRP
jgi:hypothetical protein